MKIGTINVRISPIALAVVVIFTILLIVTVLGTGDRTILIGGMRTVVLPLVIPIALNYMSQKQYADLVPVYEVEARPVRVKMINESMLNQIVRLEGVVERTYFQFLNRPQYLFADRTGEISVKMFTSPLEDIKKGDVVEVLGMVIRRYVISGEPVINCVSIRKIDKKIEIRKDKPEK